MVEVKYEKNNYSLHATETLLDGLLRHQVAYPHACKAGVCQSCLSELITGTPHPDWQIGLDTNLKVQNYFLACLCQPKEDLEFRLANLAKYSENVQILDLLFLNANVLRVRLSIKNATHFRPGQFIHLINPAGVTRSYSIANRPHCDRFIELHIKLYAQGLMSQWLQHVSVDTTVKIVGPFGHCFYHNPTQQAFPIVLAGTGTGLAPLVGIALEALSQHHQGNIYLLHGGVTRADLYLDPFLQKLTRRYASFFYQTCTLEKSSSHAPLSLDQCLSVQLQGIASAARVFVCGPEDTTRRLKMKAFLAGTPSTSIYSDAFVHTK